MVTENMSSTPLSCPFEMLQSKHAVMVAAVRIATTATTITTVLLLLLYKTIEWGRESIHLLR